MNILRVRGREVLDSRGNPTVECEMTTRHGIVRAIVPSGASTGVHEAVELRDGGKRFCGKGVTKAVVHVNVLEKKLVRKQFDQESLDAYLKKIDGTPNKTKLGANTILAISMAFCRAEALEKNIPLYQHIATLFGTKKLTLPTPFMNVINGGKHADNKLDIQECMLVPRARSFKEALRQCAETYHALKNIIHKKYGPATTNVGDEGGFAPPIRNIEEAFDLLIQAIELAGYTKEMRIAMDCAGSEFFKHGKYYLEGQELRATELLEKYEELVQQYPLISIEDPFQQEDFTSFAALTKKARVQIVGDDLLVTNVQRIRKAIVTRACNALLLKVNQIGTVSEALDAARMSKENNWNVMVSHRSGETEDTFIADLAVGLGMGQLKAGAPCRSERVAKYNQLLRIEEAL